MMSTESGKGLGDTALLFPPFSWTTFLYNLLFTNAAKICIKYCHLFFKQGPCLLVPVPRQHLSRAEGSQQGGGDRRTSLANLPIQFAQPECEFGLGLCHGPCGGGSGLTAGGMPSPSAPISLSAHRWILAPVHVSLPLQPPLQYLSILLFHHYANIEISPLRDYGDSDIRDFLRSCAFSADSINHQVYFSVS